MANIFQTPTLLIIISIAVLAVMVLYRRSFPEKGRWWQLLIPAVILAAGLSLDHFIETDLEKINSCMSNATKAFVNRNADDLAKCISQDYSDTINRSKTQLIDYCRYFFATPTIKKVKEVDSFVDIKNTSATINHHAVVHLNPNNPYGLTIASVKLRIHLARSQADWLITKVEILELNNQPFNMRSF